MANSWGMSNRARRDQLMSGATGGASGQYAEQTRNLFEEENNSQISALKDQVSALKELTLDINTEVNEQNKFLNNMSSDFDSTEGLLGGTMGKLKHMVDQGGSKHMCLLIAFVVFVFLVLWFILGKK